MNFKVVLLFLGAFTQSILFAQNTNLWGVSYRGGENNRGTIYSINPDGTGFKIRHDFECVNDGANPENALTASGGKYLYGCSNSGGIYELGTLFKYDTSNDSLIKLFDFPGDSLGGFPSRKMHFGHNGKLYGTAAGGQYKNGVLFEFDTLKSTYRTLVHFDDTSNGKISFGGLSYFSDSCIYGGVSGGPNKDGLVYKYDIRNNKFSTVLDFSKEKGITPIGGIYEIGKDSFLGFAVYSGKTGLYRYDAANAKMDVIMIFNSRSVGENATGDLFLASNNKFYGVTTRGGTNNIGVFYEYDYKRNQYRIKGSFGAVRPTPQGFVAEDTNGVIYGTTNGGGKDRHGHIFEYDIDNDKFSNKAELKGGRNGENPVHGLVLAPNGNLYGLTENGGKYGSGTVFKYESSSNKITKIHNFNKGEGGHSPGRGLVQAQNGKLYGLTHFGGKSNNGVLYEYDPKTSIYTKKIDFEADKTGRTPASIMIVGRNGKLYGTASQGGKNDEGVLFEYDPKSNKITRLHDFDLSTGGFPIDVLTLSPDEDIIYGIAPYGGNGPMTGGVVFSFKISTKTYTVLYDFASATGGIYGPARTPMGPMTLASDGNYYGIVTEGGLYGSGAFFMLNPITSKVTILRSISGSNGRRVHGSLTESGKGSFYYLGSTGGYNKEGTLTQYISKTGKVKLHISFSDSTIGYEPTGSLLRATNGKYYGINQKGGADNGGVIFEYDPNLDTVFARHEFQDSTLIVPVRWNIYGSELAEVINCFHPTFTAESKTTCDSLLSPSGMEYYKVSNIYIDTIKVANACDSIITTFLIKKEPKNTKVSMNACDSFSFYKLGTALDSTGVYFDTLTAANGCDSIVELNLTIKNSTYQSFDTTACGSFTSIGSNKIWSTSGIYLDTLINSAGCNDIYTYKLAVNQESNISYDTAACDSFIYKGSLVSQSGIYYDSLLTSKGCDSIITTKITINKSSTFSIDTTITDSFILADNRVIKQSGKYKAVITNGVGCDSVIDYTIDIITGGRKTYSQGLINVFPNPGKDNITVNISEIKSLSSLNMYTINGLCVKTFDSTQNVIVLKNLEKGVYLLKMETSDGLFVEKIVVQ
ncbi:MAG: T9SS type A sorting domain-containing protein [Bacteroidia bacterium]